MSAAHKERSPRDAALAMLGICLVVMLIALDQTVVGTALPRVVAELQGFRLYPWVATAYLLTSAVFVPITGRLGDLHGRKPFVLGSTVLFTLASVLCGMAGSMWQLVLARGLQGIGGGMLVGTAFASVSDLFPNQLQRVRWQVMLSTTFGISTALGPALGGWLTEHAGWRSVFYVNLPVGLLALATVWKFLPVLHTPPRQGTRIDWWGVLLLAVAMGVLLVTTEQGEQLGFANPWFWALVLLSLIVGGGFVRHQRLTDAPVIPPHLFSYRGVGALTLLGMLTGLVMFILIFYAPLLLQGGMHLSPNEAGVRVTPLLVLITVGSIINGRLVTRLPHPERLVACGLLVLSVGVLLLVSLNEHTSRLHMWLAFGLCGLGLGFQLPNLTLQMQAAVPRTEVGVASALIQTSRMLGSMAGASIAGLIVHQGFSRNIQAVLTRQPNLPKPVLAMFDSPQLLVRAADQRTLLDLGQRWHFDAAALLEQARLGLIHGVHAAFLACLAVMLISLWVCRYLPLFIVRTDSAVVDTNVPESV